jgi:hypothetical protein
MGAAQTVREALGVPRSRLEVPDYEQALTAIRAQIDEATFTAAWAQGKVMTLEQAISYALEGNEVDSASSIATAASQ